MAIDTYHVINDPIHGAMQFTTEEIAWLKPFIDHPVFQRLRHIKQLGFADLIFPGAVHTRFNHSLGCCYVAKQIASRLGTSAVDMQTVVIAALLHDIGHGPFSHAFEEIYEHAAIRHENWTPYFFREFYDEDFLYRYNKKNKSLPICENNLNTINKLIMHEPTDKQLLADIVSSQLDADRIDYLLRDSHFCGVKYGEFDYRWLLHCLAVIDDDGVNRLGINYKAVGVVENYLVARRLMIRNIYYHYKKYAAEHLLKEFLLHLSDVLTQSTRFKGLKTLPIGKFLEQVRIFNDKSRVFADDALKTTFIKNNFYLYKQLCDYDVYNLIRALANTDHVHVCVDIAKRLESRKLPRVFSLKQEQHDKVKQRVAEILESHKHDIHAWQLAVLNPPHHSYLSKDRIKVVDYRGRTKYIDEDSLIINALLDKTEMMCCLAVDHGILNSEPVKQLLAEL